MFLMGVFKTRNDEIALLTTGMGQCGIRVSAIRALTFKIIES